MAELTNGSLVLTVRNGQNRSASDLCAGGERCRLFARSDDGGATWARTWGVGVAALPVHRCEAGTCQVCPTRASTRVRVY